MPTILATQQEFDAHNYQEGHFFVFFTGKPDSDLFSNLQKQVKNLENQLEMRQISVFFLTQEEVEDADEFLIFDVDLELLKPAKKISSKKPGENMVVMRQMDGNLGLIDLKENPESDADWVKAIVQFGDNFNDLNADAEGYYKWGQRVPEDGEYLCKDCGYILELKEGDIFPICEVCLAGEPNGPSTPEEGYWEKI
jgi:rubrerythrin